MRQCNLLGVLLHTALEGRQKVTSASPRNLLHVAPEGRKNVAQGVSPGYLTAPFVSPGGAKETRPLVRNIFWVVINLVPLQ